MTHKQDIPSTRAFGRSVDFGRTATEYRRYRAGFPPAFFDALETRGWIAQGQRALDLGTGTGTVARGLAERGLSVLATDPATALLEQAAEIDREAGVVVDYRAGRAEAIDAPDGTFDLVTAGQCWHWFDQPRATAEAARVLAAGGRIIIAHFDWLPCPVTSSRRPNTCS
jgi:ubiquinone/menaquinone biosynthesis C-methylase UbiE